MTAPAIVEPVTDPEPAPDPDAVAAGDDHDPRRRPRRRRAVWALGFAVALVAGLLLFQPAGDDGTLDAAPGFSLESVRDPSAQVALGDFAGKPVVLNFFASWCAPCRRELPHLRAASEEWGDRVAFVGIAHQDVRSDTVELLDEFAITYPAGYDPRGRVAADYSLLGLPATVFITADGKVAELVQGEITESALEAHLEELLELHDAQVAALRSNG